MYWPFGPVLSWLTQIRIPRPSFTLKLVKNQFFITWKSRKPAKFYFLEHQKTASDQIWHQIRIPRPPFTHIRLFMLSYYILMNAGLLFYYFQPKLWKITRWRHFWNVRPIFRIPPTFQYLKNKKFVRNLFFDVLLVMSHNLWHNHYVIMGKKPWKWSEPFAVTFFGFNSK